MQKVSQAKHKFRTTVTTKSSQTDKHRLVNQSVISADSNTMGMIRGRTQFLHCHDQMMALSIEAPPGERDKLQQRRHLVNETNCNKGATWWMRQTAAEAPPGEWDKLQQRRHLVNETNCSRGATWWMRQTATEAPPGEWDELQQRHQRL